MSESSKKAPAGARELFINVIAVSIGGFMLFTSAFGALESLIQRSIFLALVSVMGLAIYPLWKGTKYARLGLMIDIAAGLFMIVACGYIVMNYSYIMDTSPFAEKADIILCYGALLVIMEISRRAVSWLFPILVVIAVSYAMFGYLIPGSFGHRGFGYDYIAEVIYLSDKGLFGMLTGVASTILAIFILFGAILLHTGAGKTFFDLAARAGGSSPGGAAKIATIASGLFGMVSGSAVANVATTGNFTIPLMRRLNYPPAFAGGVEAVASTGGQIAPPIMGTAAFVMAEFVGINYWVIALSAVIPGFLFYLGIYLTIHVIANRHNLGRVDESELPDWRQAVSIDRLSPIIASFVGFAYGIIQGYSVPLTAVYGLLFLVVAYTIIALKNKEKPQHIAMQLVQSLAEGGKGLVVVGVLLVVAQVFVAMLNLTGLGVAISNAILNLGGHNAALILFIMAGVCLLAGMGLPTSAAYVLVAAVFAPSLIQLGFEPLMVHFFVLYYATLSAITPPVCVAAFIAAAIAGTGWAQTAMYAVRLGATAYVLPLIFVLLPGLLWQGSAFDIILALISGITFTTGTAYMFGGRPVIGKYKSSLLLWLFPIGLGIIPSWESSLAGAVLIAFMIKFSNKTAEPFVPLPAQSA